MPEAIPSPRPVAGVRLGSVCAGIKYPQRLDLTVIELDAGAHCAAVFTRNRFCAAPVSVARAHLAAESPRYLLINTGNANAGTGAPGRRDAEACCSALAELAGCLPQQVLPFSTGVIGEPLAAARLMHALPEALRNLQEDGWWQAARAIMTTDTQPKCATRVIDIDGAAVVVTGIAKGAGMIRPDMATMLAFIATDAAVDGELLHDCLQEACNASFNRITIDGDTSTNDACVLIASGRAAVEPIAGASAAYRSLCAAVTDVCIELAQAIVRDGEGATKFITIEVSGGANADECSDAAYSIAHSPLVKTAFFACDPNWGRILAALGRSGIADLDSERVAIYLDEVCIVRAGARAAGYREEDGQRVMQRPAIRVHVDLGRGVAHSHVWTCDLSHEYVRINSDYRS